MCGEKLHQTLHIAHRKARAALNAPQSIQTAEQRVFGYGVLVEKHFVFGAKQSGFLARKTRYLRRRARLRLCIVRHIYRAARQTGRRNQRLVRLRYAENRRRRAEADIFFEVEILAP